MFLRRIVFVLVLALSAALASPLRAVLPPMPEGSGGPLADFDTRPGLGLEAAPTAAQLAALEKLRSAAAAAGPGAEIIVRWGGVPGTTHHIFRRGGFLSAAAREGESPAALARAFVAAHADLLGLSAPSVAALQLRGVVIDPLTEAAHVVLQQRVDGIPIYQSGLKVNLDRDGRVLSVAGNSTIETRLPGEQVISVETGLLLAARSVRVPLDAAAIPARAAQRAGEGKDEIRFEQGPFESAPWAHLRWFPRPANPLLPGGSASSALAPAWVVFVDPASDQGWYQVVVDARTGEILARHDLVENLATEGLVFREDPGQGPQLVLPFVDDTEYTHPGSPLGWSAAGLSEGNNCDSKDDRANDNEGTDGQRAVAAAGPPLAFSFPFADDPALDLNAALTNAFYLNNWLHDRLERMGFDEQSGNFQLENYGPAGLDNDRVFVDVQDGSGTNNANFGTPPDGNNPRMQMYIWTYTNPARDSAFDSSVVTHELFHGVSNRMVGLLQNDGGCLGGPQGGAMGEGFSDYFACTFWNQVTVGGYLVNNYVRGIRRAAYDTYPFDYSQLCNQGGFQVHRDGEIWAGTLWHVRQLFIDKYGFQRGRCAFDRLVLDGMKLAPCLPNYIDMRDAILLAAQLHGADGDQCLLWQGFADRGMGIAAIGRPDCTSAADASYATPPECAACSGFTAPSGVSFDTSSPNRVVANFTPSPGATEHLLLRSSAPCPGDCLDAEFTEVARGPADATQLVDADQPARPLSAGETFAYRVMGLQGACTASSACAEVSIIGRCTLRPEPLVDGVIGLASLTRPPGATCSIQLAWESMASACAPFGSLRYNIYRATDAAFTPGPEFLIASVMEPARTFVDASVPPASVTYIVRAEDLTLGGDGPHGGNEEPNVARLTLAPQGPASGAATFTDDAEAGTLPGYRLTGSYEPNDWAILSDGNTRGGSAWHVSDVEGGSADKNLHLPPLSLGSTSPRFSFSHTYQLEAEFDGGVIEISLDSGRTWRDLKDDITAGGYNSFTYTVASLMHPPNTDRLWTGQNASGFPTYDRVDVDLTPYAGTLDAQIRFRLLVDESAAEPGGWYVDDVRVDDMVTFDACTSGCVDPPNAGLSNALGCTSTTSSTFVLLDGSASTAGAAGFAADLGSVFTHDGPGSFAGRRWATGSQASLEFPPGTPAGDYPVTLTVRGADGCADAVSAVVQLRDELSVPPSLGDTLRIRKMGVGLELSWLDVGAPVTNIHVEPLGTDLAALDETAPKQRLSGGPVTLTDGLALQGAGTAFLQVFSASDCGRSVR